MSWKWSADYKTIEQYIETDYISTAKHAEFDFDKVKDRILAMIGENEQFNDCIRHILAQMSDVPNDVPNDVSNDDDYQPVERQRVRDMKVIFRFSDRPEWFSIDIEFDLNLSEKRNLIDAGVLIDSISKERKPNKIQGYDENLLLIYDDMPFQTHEECRQFAEKVKNEMECYSKLFNIGVEFL